MLRHVLLLIALVLGLAPTTWATPDFVEHLPLNQVYGEPAGRTFRTPGIPREDEAVALWVRIGFSFYYTDVAIYYTTDGTEPTGVRGVPAGSTAVLTSAAGQVAFIRNEPHSPSNIDWWKATLPVGTRAYGTTVKYKLSAWHSGGGLEVFANNYGCSDEVCNDPSAPATLFQYTVKLAWPGKGSPHPDHAVGYPAVHFWKEEGVVGNHYINVMVDQNGSVYDLYYPSAGCVQGVSTKNEGYVDGLDTFPPGLPPGHRGQMNINQAMPGLRVDGVTYWLSNEAGGDYADFSQSYLDDTNVIETTQRLVAAGHDIQVRQYDFCPAGVTFPDDDGGQPNRGLYVKRLILTNNGAQAKQIGVYFYADWAVNGGDSFDGSFTDAGRGAMIGYDNTYRLTSSSGEYNPTTFGNYEKNVSLYLAAAMKLVGAVGGGGGQPAADFWSDTSTDQGLGWVGLPVILPPGESREVNILIAGGFDRPAGATGTYAYFIDNAIDWFIAGNMSTLQAATEQYWRDWLAGGVTIDTPDDRFDQTFRRGLLATALHLDGRNGGIIAGMHNGAYPFVWPRDAAWAAITLARTGHLAEAEAIFTFLRDVAYRDWEGWGRKGFWKQKYTTDGYTVWGAPQVDETSCYPWGIKYLYDITGDLGFLLSHYDEVYEAAIASSQDSTLDSRLRYEEAVNLMYSMSLWEDAFDVFNYSNASVIRGLEDAAAIADILDQNACPGGPGQCNYHNDRALFLARAAAIRGGLDARLEWNGENTDISQLGIVYPFEIYPADHPRAALAVDRINGVAGDRWGNIHPLMNYAGEWAGLLNRYWGDTYWHNNAGPNPNGSPWFLSTMWYGCYYAMRQDLLPGKGDIDNHRLRLELLLDRVGPIGLGAEQIAPSNSLLYPGQMDFVLQAAWPNAWESMSFFVDALMMFLDVKPDAAGNTLRLEPKLPTGWNTLTVNNLTLGSHRLSVTCTESDAAAAHAFTNHTGAAVNFDTQLRVPAGPGLLGVTRDDASGCQTVAYAHDPATGRVHVVGPLALGPAAVTTITAHYGQRGDLNRDGQVAPDDVPVFIDVLLGLDSDCVRRLIADVDGNGLVDGRDVQALVSAIFG